MGCPKVAGLGGGKKILVLKGLILTTEITAKYGTYFHFLCNKRGGGANQGVQINTSILSNCSTFPGETLHILSVTPPQTKKKRQTRNDCFHKDAA